MTTSNSTDFNQSELDIITDALQLIGVVGSNDTPKTNDITFCSKILNKMIKTWEAQGIHLWTETEGTFTLTDSVNTYVLSSSGSTQSTYTELTDVGRPIAITSIRYHYNNGNDRMMRKMGREEYMRIPSKDSTGPATAYYYSPQLNNGILYIWPTPDNSDDSLNITYLRSIQDFDANTDTPDFPQEWLEALTYNLVVRIAPAFGITLSKTNPDLIAIAASSLAELQAWDFEEGSVRIVPNNRWD